MLPSIGKLYNSTMEPTQRLSILKKSILVTAKIEINKESIIVRNAK